MLEMLSVLLAWLYHQALLDVLTRDNFQLLKKQESMDLLAFSLGKRIELRRPESSKGV